jgi:hypothetical protein
MLGLFVAVIKQVGRVVAATGCSGAGTDAGLFDILRKRVSIESASRAG